MIINPRYPDGHGILPPIGRRKERSPSSKTDPIIAFTDAGRVSGTSGCNIFFGGHDLSGSTLRIHDIESTKMTSTPEVLDQEKVFFTLLQKTRAYTIDGDCLRLFDASGREILSFTSQTQPLQGKAWYLWSPRNDTGGAVQDPGTDQISLQFLGESQFRGTAAGTDYCGTYEASGDTIRFGPAEGWVELPEWALLAPETGARLPDNRGSTRHHERERSLHRVSYPDALHWSRSIGICTAPGGGWTRPPDTGGDADLILFMPDGMITGIIHGIQLFAQYDADDSSISLAPSPCLLRKMMIPERRANHGR